MMSIKEVYISSNGIIVGGQEIALYSGAVHYWRLDRDLWESILDQIAGMGFSIIETYIPWSVHECREGRYDFGTIDKSKDVNAFLSLCRDKGLYVLVRPGPHINAELTYFGFPEWILFDEEVKARDPWLNPVIYPYFSKPFPIPSYASEQLFGKTELYFNQIRPLLLKHQYPKGPIIAIQADNETCYFFRDSAYGLDYSGDSIRLYHAMLEEKYHSIDQLNKLYNTSYQAFFEIPAPRGFSGETVCDLPYYLDWTAYKEYQILKAQERMVRMIREMGLSIPVFHNAAYQHYTPVNIARSERIDGMSVVGLDAYPDPHEHEMIRERVRYMAGSSRLPFIPEFGSGSWFDRGVALTPAQEAFSILLAFMHGLKAANYYMIVERDRWFGSPIRKNGKIRKDYYNLFLSINSFFKAIRFHRYLRKPSVLVLKNYDMGRLKLINSAFDPNMLSSNCFVKGLDFPPALFKGRIDSSWFNIDPDDSHWSKEKWIDQACGMLDSNCIDYDLADLNVSDEKIRQYQVVLASTYDFMDARDQERLLDYVRQGGQLWIGPSVPCLDRDFKDCSILDALLTDRPSVNIGKGRLNFLPDPRGLPITSTFAFGGFKVVNPNSKIGLSVHGNGQNQLLFLANYSDQMKAIDLEIDQATAVEGLWCADFKCVNHVMTCKIQPYSVSIFKSELKEVRHD